MNGRALTAEEYAAQIALTQQLLQRVEGVPAGIAIEALVHALGTVLIGCFQVRAQFDELVDRLPAALKKKANIDWTFVRAQVEQPPDATERMQ